MTFALCEGQQLSLERRSAPFKYSQTEKRKKDGEREEEGPGRGGGENKKQAKRMRLRMVIMMIMMIKILMMMMMMMMIVMVMMMTTTTKNSRTGNGLSDSKNGGVDGQLIGRVGCLSVPFMTGGEHAGAAVQRGAMGVTRHPSVAQQRRHHHHQQWADCRCCPHRLEIQ